jgi:hypothetical protein
VGEPLPSPALRGSRDYHTARSQAWTRHTRAMCTRALRPPQAASPLARMRTAPASPRAPCFHLAVNPSCARPHDRDQPRGHAIAGGGGTQADAFGNSGASTSCSAALGASRHCRSLPWPPGFFRAGPVVCVKEMVLWSCGRGEGQSFWYYVGCKGFSDCDPVKTAVLGSGPGAPPFGRHIQLVTVTLLEVTLLNKIRSSLET